MATIYDVAKLSGVSAKTVSRVLNGDAPVGKSTREAVEAAMAQLGYVPSNAARMMRSNRSGLIGLITGAISRSPADVDEPVGLPDLFIVQGIQNEFLRTNRTLMIADTGGDGARVADLIRTFLQHRVEGLIYVADHHQAVELPPLPESTPMVLANCYDGLGTPAVLPDDRAGQRALVARLIAAGHSRIGFLTLDGSLDAARLRLEGYRDALDAAGIAFDPALVRVGYEQGSERDAARLNEALGQLLALDTPPTLICTGNDEMALRLYGLLRTRGIKVPEEISVAGYDDYRVIAETLYPSLTTVALPYFEIGRASARRLIDRIEAPGALSETQPELISGPVAWRSSVTDITQGNVVNISGRKPK